MDDRIGAKLAKMYSKSPGENGTEFMISYAQNAEDVLIRRVFPDRETGFYIDVGANHPLIDSVTHYFYTKGWRGINIEPIGPLYRKLVAERPRDINIEVGVSDEVGDLTFYEAPEYDGWSTFSSEHAAQHRSKGVEFFERPILITTLARICEEHAADVIDFLKIDVEGFERNVLAGADFRRFRPVLILVESTEPNSRISSHQPWESLLIDADYSFATSDGLNRYYVRAEDDSLAERLRDPVCLFDNYVPYRFYVWYENWELLKRTRLAKKGAPLRRLRRRLKAWARNLWGGPGKPGGSGMLR